MSLPEAQPVERNSFLEADGSFQQMQRPHRQWEGCNPVLPIPGIFGVVQPHPTFASTTPNLISSQRGNKQYTTVYFSLGIITVCPLRKSQFSSKYFEIKDHMSFQTEEWHLILTIKENSIRLHWLYRNRPRWLMLIPALLPYMPTADE